MAANNYLKSSIEKLLLPHLAFGSKNLKSIIITLAFTNSVLTFGNRVNDLVSKFTLANDVQQTMYNSRSIYFIIFT